MLKNLFAAQVGHLGNTVEILMMALTISFVYFIIIGLLGVFSLFRFQRKLNTLIDQSKRGQEVEAFADRYFQVSNGQLPIRSWSKIMELIFFRCKRALAQSWVSYKKSISYSSGKRTANQPAEDVFQSAAVVDHPLFLDFFKHLPGLFTATGILGTFGGVIVGLMAFHISGDAAAAKLSLETLLLNVKEAFSLSAMAIVLAVGTTLIEKLMITVLSNQNTKICHSLDSLFELINESQHIYETSEHTGKMQTDTEQMLASLRNIENILMGKSGGNTVFASLLTSQKEQTEMLVQGLTSASNTQTQALVQAIHTTEANQTQALTATYAKESQSVIKSQANQTQHQVEASEDNKKLLSKLEEVIKGKLSGLVEIIESSISSQKAQQDAAAVHAEALQDIVNSFRETLKDNLVGNEKNANVYQALKAIDESTKELRKVFNQESLSETFGKAFSATTTEIEEQVGETMKRLLSIVDTLPKPQDISNLSAVISKTTELSRELNQAGQDQAGLSNLKDLVLKMDNLVKNTSDIVSKKDEILNIQNSLSSWQDAAKEIANGADNAAKIAKEISSLSTFNPQSLTTKMSDMAGVVESKYENSLHSLSLRAETIQQLLNGINSVKIEPEFINALNRLVDSMPAISNTTYNLELAGKGAESLASALNVDRIQAFSDSIEGVKDNMHSIAGHVGLSVDRIKDLNQSVDSQLALSDQVSSSLLKTTENLSITTDKLSYIPTAFNAASDKVNNAAEKLLLSANALESSAKTTEEYSKNMVDASAEIQKASTALGTTQNTVLSSMNQIGNGVINFSAAVTNSVDKLTESLSGLEAPPTSGSSKSSNEKAKS